MLELPLEQMVWSGDTLDMSMTVYVGAVPLKVKSGK
jgi:hypothetical protein